MRNEDDAPEDFESDGMRPDAEDRAPRRERSKPSRSGRGFAMSRQHVKLGIGIVVLLLLIYLISSALKAPAPQSSGPREVDLGSGASSQQAQPPVDSGAGAPSSSQPVMPPPIAGTPTQSTPAPETPNQQRVEIPGEITDALSAQQEQLNRLKETEMAGGGSASQTSGGEAQPTQPTHTSPPPVKALDPVQGSQTKPKQAEQQPTKTAPKATESATKAPVAKGSSTPGSASALASIPANRVTLQVSSASRSDTLVAFAKKNGMTDYWVYQTQRNGKPWFILITGNYASASEARAALSTMSKDVQANKPWVRSMQQVHQDLKQK